MMGSLKRQRNTGDTVGDFILEYGQYEMHAMIGGTDADSIVDEALQFAEMTVDLGVLAASGGKVAFTVISAAGLVAIINTLSF